LEALFSRVEDEEEHSMNVWWIIYTVSDQCECTHTHANSAYISILLTL